MNFEPMVQISPATRELLRKHDEQNEIRERFLRAYMKSVTETTSPAPSCCPSRRWTGINVFGTRNTYATRQASVLSAGVTTTKQTRVNAHAASTIIIEKTQRIVIYKQEQ